MYLLIIFFHFVKRSISKCKNSWIGRRYVFMKQLFIINWATWLELCIKSIYLSNFLVLRSWLCTNQLNNFKLLFQTNWNTLSNEIKNGRMLRANLTYVKVVLLPLLNILFIISIILVYERINIDA